MRNHRDLACWISWNDSRRSRVFSAELGLLTLIKEIKASILKRNLLSFVWTIHVLSIHKPNRIYCQYSFLLLIAIYFYKKIMPYHITVICDCHTKALRRTPTYFNSIFLRLKKLSFSCANAIIVSNHGNLNEAKKLHTEIYVIPDIIPNIRPNKKSLDYLKSIEKYIVFPLSYDTDEPLEIILESSKNLPIDTKYYLTGIPKLKNVSLKNYPNICLTGYLNDEDYISLLSQAICIIGLTTESDCLQSSGYEAISLAIPFITSDTTTLRQFFNEAALYTHASSEGIENAIKNVIKNRDKFKSKIDLLRKKRIFEDQKNLNFLKKICT